jgi:regulator of ribonuclease activity A
MARNAEIIRTADICDDHADELLVCELAFSDYAGRDHFHGEVVTFATHEDNKGLRAILDQGGADKVLVIDGRGSIRRALCGGNIAAQAFEQGWEGIIFNGAIRDAHEFAGLDFGVKAVGTTAMPPRHDGIGREGVTLYFGNVAISPGDYVYADRDAVIVLERPVHG